MENETDLIAADTIQIALYYPNFKITDINRFGNNTMAFIQNPSRADKAAGFYKPRLTFNKKSFTNPSDRLFIEASLPKLIYGENVSELRQQDKNTIAELLTAHLKDMGVSTTPENILQADLKRLDCAKNLILPKGITATYALRTLNNTYISGQKQKSEIKYINGGAGIALRYAHREFILYDKISDLAASGLSENLSIEKDYYTQKGLLRLLKELGLYILRLEYRLANRREVRTILHKQGIANPVLGDIFTPGLTKNLLVEQWETLTRYPAPVPVQLSASQKIQQFIRANSKIKLHTALKSLAFAMLSEELTVDGTLQLLQAHYSKQDIYHLMNKSIEKFPMETQERELLDGLSAQLQEWQALSAEQLIKENK